MGWVCPTSLTDHGLGLHFPNEPAMNSGCCDAMSSVPKQGSRLGASNPAASPCPAPPPCFHKKLVHPQGIFLLDELLPAVWRECERKAWASASSSCSQVLLWPRTGMSATAPAWDMKDCSSCLVSCFEILILGLGLQVPHSCTFATHLGSGSELILLMQVFSSQYLCFI